jgi:uncharacterized protein YdhG (YjbR/CyaY superfamily)
MRSSAKTVDEYISSLPRERQEAIEKVRKVILKHLPEGYEEVMNWGMITYQVPLSRYPDTYNKEPLMYAALASQKNHMAVYMIGIYANDSLRQQFEKDYKESGKRMDIGKGCVRFRTIDDLPLDLVGHAIAAFDVNGFIEAFERARSKR